MSYPALNRSPAGLSSPKFPFFHLSRFQSDMQSIHLARKTVLTSFLEVRISFVLQGLFSPMVPEEVCVMWIDAIAVITVHRPNCNHLQGSNSLPAAVSKLEHQADIVVRHICALLGEADVDMNRLRVIIRGKIDACSV